MASKREPLDIDDMPELEKLAARVVDSQQPVILRRAGRNIARLVPIEESKPSGKKRPKRRNAGEVLLEMAGMGKGQPGGPGSGDKHELLLETHYKLHRSE